MEFYHCKTCDTTKPIESFYLRASGRPQSACKACRSEQSRAKYQSLSAGEKLARARKQNLTQKYGMSEATYQQMSTDQEGVCAICGRPERILAPSGKPRRLAVDHDHTSGEIRALLCHACNTAIGKFEDNPELLRKAADYLERPHHGYT